MKKILFSIILIIGCATTPQVKDINICDLQIDHPDYLECIKEAVIYFRDKTDRPSMDQIYCVCKEQFIRQNIPQLLNEKK